MQARRPTRASVPLLPRYRADSGFEFVEGQCIDISIGGMFMASHAPLDTGTLLKFECLIDGQELPLKGLARVVWQRAGHGDRDRPSGMGLKFVKLEPDCAEMVERLVGEARAVGMTAPRQPLPAHYVLTDSAPPPAAEPRASSPTRMSLVTAVPVASEAEAEQIELPAPRTAAGPGADADHQAPPPRPESMRVPRGTTPRTDRAPAGREAVVPGQRQLSIASAPREVPGAPGAGFWLALGASLFALAWWFWAS